MSKFAMLLVALAVVWGGKTEAQAQVPYATFYQPVTVFRPPVAYAPRTVYYAPVVAAPAAPVVAAPVAPVYEPVARVRSRYRPLLGRTVTRVRYGYAPAYYSAAPVVYAY